MTTGTTWFGTRGHHLRRRTSAETVRRLIQRELRDCGTWVHVEPVPLEPFVVSRPAYDELFDAAHRILALLRRTVAEAAPTRAGRLSALGVTAPGDRLPFLTDDEAHEWAHCDLMARPDIVIGPDGPRFLEFNVSGAFGGPAETHLFTGVWRQVYGGDEAPPFLAYDPLAARADLFAALCAERGLARGVGLIGDRRDRRATTDRYFDVEARFLRRRGFDAEVWEPGGLLATAPSRARSFPLALCYFAPSDWLSRGDPLDPVRAVMAAGTLLLPPQTSYLLADKKTLAWLSAGQPWMDAADRALVDRYVPWTRVTREARVAWRGEQHDLRELLLRRQELFVLKSAGGMMGTGVLIGRSCPASRWSAAVATALDREDAVVQEYVEPARYEIEMVAATGGDPYRVAVAPVLSPCLFGGRPGGCYVRYHPSGRGGVVGVARGGAMENVLVAAG